jgi:hypothetical protein
LVLLIDKLREGYLSRAAGSQVLFLKRLIAMFDLELIQDIQETVDPELWEEAFEDIYESIVFSPVDIVESLDDIS